MAAQLFEDYKSALEEKIKSPEYLANLKNRQGLRVPDFCPHASPDATILAILRDPSMGDVSKTNMCSIHYNHDQTAKNQRNILGEVGINWETARSIVFWNFYGAFGSFDNAIDEKQNRKFWAERMAELITELQRLKVIMVCGKDAENGMNYYVLPQRIKRLYSPLPSQRGLNGHNGREKAIAAWREAKQLATI